MEERIFDCPPNFAVDDAIEQMLEEHFEKFSIPKQEICRNFQIYTRRAFLKRFLAHYEFFQQVINLPGDIVELGVHRGGSLMSWANFLEIRNMGDRQRKVIGFDHFKNSPELDSQGSHSSQHSAEDKNIGEKISKFEEQLWDAIRIFDSDRFIPYKPRVILVKGDIQQTVPKYIDQNPSLRISLLHIDVDLYQPTLVGLQHLWQRVVTGGIVLLDGYGVSPWEGESKAIDEFFVDQKVTIKRLDWCSSPGGYIVKNKFPQKTREEIAPLLGLGDLTQTRFYQEAFGEGRQEGEYLAKLATIKRLSKLNLPVEVIAQGVEISMAEVQQAIEQLNSSDLTY